MIIFEKESDPQKAAEISRQFDKAVYALAGNSVLIGFLETLKGVIERDRKYSSANKGRREEISSSVQPRLFRVPALQFLSFLLMTKAPE